MATGTTAQTTLRAGDLTTIKFAWLASSGTGSMAAAGTEADITKDLRGMYCVMAVTEPGATTAPADNYDIAVNDSFGCDIFARFGSLVTGNFKLTFTLRCHGGSFQQNTATREGDRARRDPRRGRVPENRYFSSVIFFVSVKSPARSWQK